MFAIACWLIFSVLVGLFANGLGRSGAAWTTFSMIFSPSLGLLFVAILDEKPVHARAARSLALKRLLAIRVGKTLQA
ncbi:hypothetical protein [Cupriavidus consociatus]|uniref:hypothetical protein n=1 Tax=Cupriavidus consociatus TaxID=2821357 RepID=UPI001AE1AF17|nr:MULTISPECIES: hypothetical protein [unclassified Cupriavidus]MBP0618871.1 hypothetical protein [Cupriavidus sp. LEh25]MDK2655514.1 hypothetical protein [Cupriavidus sp. LEh21]